MLLSGESADAPVRMFERRPAKVKFSQIAVAVSNRVKASEGVDQGCFCKMLQIVLCPGSSFALRYIA